MKTSIIKKSLVCALTAALVMAPVMGVSAKTTVTPSGESVVVEAVNDVIASWAPSETTSGTTSGTTSTVSSIAEAVALIPATSSVAGVTTTVPGAYLVTNVNGVAITTPLNNILGGYGLASGERAYAKAWNFVPKKSHLAYAVIENAAASIGAEIGPALQFEFGKMDVNGKYGLLPQDGPAFNVAIGIPASFANAGKTFAVVRVRAGGSFSILQDLDNDPNTITFATTGGAGAYAIIRY